MAAFADYEDYDAVGLAGLIRAKDVSADEVLEAAIERAEARNPDLNAIVRPMYEEARAALAAGLPDGPLRGVPYLLKDLGQFYAGVPTTGGSRLFHDFVPDHDSTYTARCKAAGLVIFGKTNTPEMGLVCTTESQLLGPARNPWNLDRSTGGSSGGATAAVAARILPAAHATDGGGSIRIPAANCGVFGLKPTRARNPAGPDLGEGWSGMATGHAASISVRDSAALLDATHGPAPGDPYCAPPPARPFADEVGADPGALRIAMLTATYDGQPIHSECVAAIEDAAALLRELGHDVVEAAPDLEIAALKDAMRTIIGANVWNAVAARAGDLGREPSGQDLEAVTWLFAQEGRQRRAADYAGAVTTLHRAGRQFAGFFQDHDLVLSTVMANPPLPLGRTSMMMTDLDAYCDELFGEIPFTPLYNMTGHPAMSVPLAWSRDGLPIGIHVGARFGDEATLLRLAAQLEQARPWRDRRPPQ